MTLTRHVPLRSRPKRDPVTAEVRDEVLWRDKGCLLARIEPEHVCRNRWGTVHSPTDLTELTLEHVKDALTMGKRAPSDPAHLIALCYVGNLRPPTKAQRAAFRAYLSALIPASVA